MNAISCSVGGLNLGLLRSRLGALRVAFTIGGTAHVASKAKLKMQAATTSQRHCAGTESKASGAILGPTSNASEVTNSAPVQLLDSERCLSRSVRQET